MTKYNVTNPTQANRVIHDVNNKGIMIESGNHRVVDLNDHDAETLLAAMSGDAALRLLKIEEPKVLNDGDVGKKTNDQRPPLGLKK